MVGEPLVSVVINNYNYDKYIMRAIESVKIQTYYNIELVIVDDGSTDNSRQILESKESEFGIPYTLIFQNNAGQAAAINRGVEASKGEIIFLLDADDEFLHNKVTEVVSKFEKNPEIEMIYHKLAYIIDDSVTSRQIPRAIHTRDLGESILENGGWWDFPMTSSLAARRSLFEKILPIPSEFIISADSFVVTLTPLISKIVGLDEVLGLYRIHSSNNWSRLGQKVVAEDYLKRVENNKRTAFYVNQRLRKLGKAVEIDLSRNYYHTLLLYRIGDERLISPFISLIKFGGLSTKEKMFEAARLIKSLVYRRVR